MSNKKQTANDWYIDEYSKIHDDFCQKKLNAIQFVARKVEIKARAKQMEKEQIENAYNDGWFRCTEYMATLDPEQYYTDNYGGRNE
jgi:hypothetical protein